MKQKDIALIAVIIFVSAVFSLFLSKAIFASPKNRQQSVDNVQAISSTFTPIDSRFFNTDSIDPAKAFNIGDDSNDNPFNGTSQ